MIDIRTLDNGMTVITKTVPGVKTATAGVWFKTGSRDEVESNNGISHFLEHMFFRGSSGMSGPDLEKIIEDLGGYCNAWTDTDQTGFYVSTLDKNMGTSMQALSECLSDPGFRTEDIEIEKGAVVQEILMYQDDPDSVLYYNLYEQAFRSDPIGRRIIGTKENVLGFTREDLFERTEKYYSSDNATFIYVGPRRPDDVAKMVEKCFSGMKRGSRNNDRTTPPFNSATHHFFRDDEQYKFSIAHEAPVPKSEDALAAKISSTIMGGSMRSRLFSSVRNDLGLAYSVYSSYNYHDGVGILDFYAGTSPDLYPEAKKVMEHEISKAADEGFTEEELERAKAILSYAVSKNEENPSSMIDPMAAEYDSRGKITGFDEKISRIESVTLGDVNRVFKNVIGSNRVEVGVGRE